MLCGCGVPVCVEYYSFGPETIAYGQQFSPAPPRTFGITARRRF